MTYELLDQPIKVRVLLGASESRVSRELVY